jgi:prophage antirepressor-like protein
MNELTKVFNYQSKEVRTIVKDGEPWFVAKDVCDVLGLTNPSESLKALDSDEKSTLRISEGGPEVNIINEPGLYLLVIRSNKSEAKQFKRWITHEVIPSIRKYGTYMTPETIEKVLLNPDTIIKIATQLKEEQQKRIEAETKLEQQKPLVLFAETCIASKDSLLVREVAKLACKNGIEIGEKRLYQKLREWKLIMKCSTEPYQSAMDSELFEIKVSAKQTPYGTDTYRTTKVTPKGQVYIIEKLRKETKKFNQCSMEV